MMTVQLLENSMVLHGKEELAGLFGMLGRPLSDFCVDYKLVSSNGEITPVEIAVVFGLG